MYIQMLYHFWNTSSPDDDPRLGRENLENNEFWKVYQTIPAEYH